MPLQTFVHEFKSPINCKALAVRHGFNAYPVALFEGRQCYALPGGRVWGGKGRAYHNRVSVHFLDTDEIRSIPAGEWGRKAKTVPLPQE